MLSSTTIKRIMSRSGATAFKRTQAIARHMSSQPEEPLVLFESLQAVRTYKLNRPKKLNSLNTPMCSLLQSKVEEWSKSDICAAIWGSGEGRAFCAGGDVAGVVQDAADPNTRNKATQFFKSEFTLDYLLAATPKPYIAIMDGITMGGGVGLSMPASFRVATENTVLAMPETKIGYAPDVGASYYLSRLDGELGTYLALTAGSLEGRAVFEHGFATHFIPARRIPMLLESVSALNNTSNIEGSPQDFFAHINQLIEEYAADADQTGSLTSELVGSKRLAIDYAFRHNEVEKIFQDLRTLCDHSDPSISKWASTTIDNLNMRSPTSLKVALRAIRSGRTKGLLQALKMELEIAVACCKGGTGDFKTGVEHVLVTRSRDRPEWSPSAVEEVTPQQVDDFFNGKYMSADDVLEIPEPFSSAPLRKPNEYALPTEVEIRDMVIGAHTSGGGSGITRDELVSRFEDLYNNKIGVKEKVSEVVSRKCEIVDNADGNTIWLKWTHSVKSPQ